MIRTAAKITALLLALSPHAHSQIHLTDLHKVEIVTIVEGLKHPWGMAFQANGDILITERVGTLRRLSNGKLSDPIQGVPEVAAINQGGLLDIALHPEDQNKIYLSYSEQRTHKNYATTVITAKLKQQQLTDIKIIFRAQPAKKGGRHFGSRFLFTDNQDLLITVGDRADRPSAQDKTQHHGSVIIIKKDQLEKDNPKAEIYSHGHRNQQGITYSCDRKHIWAHEHGPRGGDELNLIQQGNNYGWPVISYGRSYILGTKIGDSHKEGMEQPVHKWIPSIGPSGLICYDQQHFPQWNNNLLLGSLIYGQLVRLELDSNNQVIKEERMLDGAIGRVRDVRTDQHGNLYLLSDSSNGKLVRLQPAD